ncbi:MAG: helix-turn-helix transcriptional regulator [Acidimicrobiales bacterium]
MRSQQAPGLNRLAPETWRLAEVAAAMSQPFSLDVLAPVVGQTLGRLQPALSDALAAGVFLHSGAELRFRDDLVRQAIYFETPLPKRMSLHRRIEVVEAARRRGRAHPFEADRGRSPERPTGVEASAPPAPLKGTAPIDGPRAGARWVGEEDLHTARLRAERILGGAGPGDSDAELAEALSTLASMAWNEGRVADTISLLRAAARRAEQAADVAGALLAQLGMAVVFTALADVGVAASAIRALAAGVTRVEHLQWAPGPALCRSRLFLVLGRTDEARVAAHEAWAAADQDPGSPFGAAALVVLALLALRQRDVDAAEGWLARGSSDQAEEWLAQRACEPAERQVRCSQAWIGWVHAHLAEARHGPLAGYDVVAGVCADPAAHSRLFVEYPQSAPWLVQVALAASQPGAAEAVARWAEHLAAVNRPFLSVTCAAAHARALLAHDVDALERVGSEHPLPGGRAAACEDAGSQLVGAGDRARARLQLERALAIFECMGAAADQVRLQRRLDELGKRSRCRRAERRPVSGWGSLTDAERRVADLVAAGLSNPEAAKKLFLSRHTVDFHLRHVFRKLNVGSRVELTRLALQRD